MDSKLYASVNVRIRKKKNLWKKVKALLWWLWLADLTYTQGLTRVNINPMSWSWADNSMIYKNIIAPELPSMQPVKFLDITVMST